MIAGKTEAPGTHTDLLRGFLPGYIEGVALLAFGTMLPLALELGDELDATVINMRFVKPLDEALVAELAGSHRLLVTLEENMVQGGAGSAVADRLVVDLAQRGDLGGGAA